MIPPALLLVGMVRLLIWTLLFFGSRRRRLERSTSDAPIRSRSREHEAALNMLEEWFAEPKIIAAWLRTGYTVDGLGDIQERVHSMTEREVYGLIAVLTRDRQTRRVMADFTVRTQGFTKEQAMKALLEMHEIGSGKGL